MGTRRRRVRVTSGDNSPKSGRYRQHRVIRIGGHSEPVLRFTRIRAAPADMYRLSVSRASGFVPVLLTLNGAKRLLLAMLDDDDLRACARERIDGAP